MRSDNRLLMKTSWDEPNETELTERTLIRTTRLKTDIYRDWECKRKEWRNSVG